MSDIKNIKSLCDTLDIKYYDLLSETTKTYILCWCYELLKQYPHAQPIIRILQQRGNVQIHDIGGIPISIYDMFVKLDRELSDVEKLQRIGVVTIPLLDQKALTSAQIEFLKTLRSFPEYQRSQTNPDRNPNGQPIVYVLGGFAALGNPASFHNPLVRQLRQTAYKKVVPLFKEYCANKIDNKGWYLQCLIDRMMFRLKGQKPVAETWHRDVVPHKLVHPSDEIFGGWINLSSDDQFFSCIPGSHLNVIPYNLDQGFATLEKSLERALALPKGSKDVKKEMTKISEYRYKFRVPPGHLILFPQYILHEVIANKAESNMRRLFVGWRLTKTPKPLFPLELLDEQAVIPLPSGQIPPMYSSNHVSYYIFKEFEIAPGIESSLTQWSQHNFLDELLVLKKKKDRPNEEYEIIPRHMESLKHYKLKMYPEYTESEKSIYIGKRI
jgi:hypothetical protein